MLQCSASFAKPCKSTPILHFEFYGDKLFCRFKFYVDKHFPRFEFYVDKHFYLLIQIE